MPDMLVKLYRLPDHRGELARLAAEGIVCRRAEPYERSAVVQFTRARWPQWPDEVAAGFAQIPPTIYIAAAGTKALGFACYNATRPNFFGPTGVDEGQRGRGIGRVLLLQCLEALAHQGYAYAIIGGVGPAAFYEKACGATIIAGSDPGIYGNFVRPTPT